MLKKVSLLLIVIFISTNINAQQKVIDSLEQQLINPTNGLTKLQNITWLSYYYSRMDPEKGLKKANQAIELALKTKDTFELGKAYEYKGLNYKSLGKDSLMSECNKKAESIYKSINHERGIAILTLNTGIYYQQRGKHTEAINHFNRAYKSFITTKKDSTLIGYTYGRLGRSLTDLGDYTKAMEWFLKGENLLEKINQKQSMYYGSIKGDMGLLYQKLSKYEKAIELHKKCLKIYTEHNFIRGVANQYDDIANSYTKQKKFSDALKMYKKSYEIKKKIKNRPDIANTLTNIGRTYMHLMKHGKAISYLDSAKIIEKELDDKHSLSNIYEGIATIFFNKKNYLKAKQNYDSAYYYAKIANIKKAIFNAKYGQSLTNYKLGNHKLAYTLLKETMGINDSLLNDDKKEQLATLKAKYEFDKEKAILEATFEKDKALDASNLKRQVLIRNLSIGGGILGLLLLGVGLTLFRRKKEAELNAQLATTELQKIKAQMNPHFIFNTLGSINDFILKNKKEEASNYLVQFSTMMRKILDNSQEEEISLQEEIAFLDNYLKLEQQRLNQKFTYNITVDEAIHTENTYIPPSLLQPYVENSVWHGISPKPDNNGQINIDFTIKNNALVCTIDDNGVGLQEKNTVNRTSFSTKSAENRLNILNTLKGSNAKVNIIEKEQGIRVIIQLPLSVE